MQHRTLSWGILLNLLGTLSFAQAAQPLIFCADAPPEGFDPPVWDTVATSNVVRQLYQGLMRFKPGTTELEPHLAESYTLSADELTYTFKLRPDVQFHSTSYFTPSRPLSADDVVFTFERILNPDSPYNQNYKQPYLMAENVGFTNTVKSVRKLDDQTVEITLKSPNAPFLSILAMTVGFILSKEYADQLLVDNNMPQINQKPIGTGPFQFQDYRKDANVRFIANPHYWKKPQKTEQLIFSIVKDPSVRLEKIKNNECHITTGISLVLLEDVKNHPDIMIETKGAMNVSYLAYNLHRPFFKEVKVRHALDMAIDRDAIFKALFPTDKALQAINPYPPTVLGWNKNNHNEYNPEKAKQLLKEAGIHNLKLNLWYLPIVSSSNPNGKLVGQMIQQDWQKIGVETELKTYEWAEYLKRAGQGEHDVYMSGWTSDSGDPDDFLYPALSCSVSREGQRFCNAEFDALLEQGRQTSDTAKRQTIYEKALTIFKEERPWITLAHSTINVPMRKNVAGFIMRPNGGYEFEDVYLK